MISTLTLNKAWMPIKKIIVRLRYRVGPEPDDVAEGDKDLRESGRKNESVEFKSECI
jgi:hypothetical protein